MITDNETPANVIARAAQVLQNCYNSLKDVEEYQHWLAGISLADLEDATAGMGFSPQYAQALKTAFADADAARQFIETGLPPSTYPQPPSAYIYAASMFAIMGPGAPKNF